MQILLAAQLLAMVGHGIPDREVTLVMCWIVAATTFASGAAYLWRWTRGATAIEDEQP